MLSKNHPLKKNDLLSRHMSPDSIMKEVVEPINPGYGGVGTKMNCRRCTFGYEMQRRGLDLAATRSHAGTGQTPTSLLNAIDPESNLPTGKTAIKAGLFKEIYQMLKRVEVREWTVHYKWL